MKRNFFKQSRFLAIVSDSARQQELIAAANNAAGASDEQYAKTLESLESKVAKLTNAWDSFTMGITNATAIKVAIDILTGLLTAVNGVTDGVGNLVDRIPVLDGDMASFAARVGILLATLSLGDKILRTFVINLRAVDSTGKKVNTTLGAMGKTAKDVVKNGFDRLKTVFNKKYYNGKIFEETGQELSELNKKYIAVTKAANDYSADAKNALSTSSRNSAIESEKKALAEKNKILEQSKEILNLSETEQLAYNASIASGASIETAAMLAKKGYTAAQLEALGATKNADLQQKLANAGLLRTTIIQKALAKSTDATTGATKKGTFATWLHKAATDAANGSVKGLIKSTMLLYGKWILLIIAVQLLIALFKYIKNNTPDAKLQQLAEATNAAKEAAENAMNAYKDLSDSLDSLGDKYNNLKNLTKGTKEWRDAVREINSEVLDLVSQYPELSHLVTSNNGVLTIDIDSKAVQDALDARYDTAVKAYAGANELDRTKRQIEANRAYNKIDSDIRLSGVLSDTEFNELAKKFASGEMGANQEQWAKAAFEAIGDRDVADKWAATVEKNGERVLREYGNQLIQNANADIANLETIRSQVLSGFEDTYSSKILSAAEGYLTADRLKSIRSEIKGQDIADSDYEEYFKTLYANQNVTFDSKDNVKVDGEQVYSADQAKTIYRMEQLEEQVKKLTDAMATATKTWKTEGNKSIVRAFESDEGKKLTQQEIDDLLNPETRAAAWEKLGKELQDQLFGGDESKFDAEILRIANLSQDRRDTANKNINPFFDTSKMANLESGAYAEYASQMQELLTRAGLSATQKWSDEFLRQLEGLSQEDREQAIAAFNAIDITSLNDIADLPNTIIDMVPSLEGYRKQLTKSAAELVTLTKATEKLSLEEMTNRISSLGEAIDAFNKNESELTIDDDAFKSMGLDNYKELFTQNFDETWTYIGESILTFVEVLREKYQDTAKALLDDAQKQLELNRQLTGQGVSKTTVDDAVSTDAQKDLIRQIVNDNFDLISQMSSDSALFQASVANDINSWLDSAENLSSAWDELTTVVGGTAEIFSTLNPAIQQMASLFSSQGLSSQAADLAGLRKQYASATGAERDALKAQLEVFVDSFIGALRRAGISEGLLKGIRESLDNIDNGDVFEEAVYTGAYDALRTQQWDKLTSLFEEMDTGLTNLSKLDNQESRVNYLNDKVLASSGIKVTDQNYSTVVGALQQLIYGNIQDAKQFVGLLMAAAGYAQSSITELASGNVIFADLNDNAKELVTWLESFGLTLTDTEGKVQIVMSETLKDAQRISGTWNKWENTYNWLYNLNLQINQLTRERNRLELQYQRSLKLNAMTTAEARDYAEDRLKSVQQETELYKTQFENAQKEIDTIQGSALGKRFGKYIQISNGRVEPDSEKVATAGWNADTGEAFTKYVDKLQGFEDNKQETLDKIQEAIDELIDLQDLGKEQYYDLLDTLQSALENQAQKAIEQQQSIAEAIQSANSDILDAVRESIDYERQIRDNTEKEKDLTDKRNRLAYLQRDTSGANAVEILNLQKQIDEESQSYTDTLIDQSLTEMENANAKAEEQRQAQIDIAQSQYDFWSENWSRIEADKMLRSALNDESFAQSDVAEKIQDYSDDFKNLPEKEWAEAWNGMQQNFDLAKIWGKDSIYSEVGETVAKLEKLYEQLAPNEGKDTFGGKLTDFSEAVTNGWIKNVLESINGGIGGSGGNDSYYKTDVGASENGKGIYNSGTNTSSNQKTFYAEGWESKLTSVNTGLRNTLSKDPSSMNKQNTWENYQAWTSELEKYNTKQDIHPSGWGQNNLGTNSELQDILDYITKKIKEGYTISPNLMSKIQEYYELSGQIEGKIQDNYKNYLLSTGQIDEKIMKNFEIGYQGYLQQKDNQNKDYELKDPKAIEDELSSQVIESNSGLKFYRIRVPDGNIFGTSTYGYILEEDIDKIQKIGKMIQIRPKASAKAYKYPFKTGGLADFTGPAWLDGTKSRPELVLNQTDTANFIQLKDILADIMRTNKSTSQPEKTSTTYFDVDVNVDRIDDNYSVDEMADRIKEIILEDSRRRNVNSIDNSRV